MVCVAECCDASVDDAYVVYFVCSCALVAAVVYCGVVRVVVGDVVSVVVGDVRVIISC